jgi:hypothetical protein
MSNPEYPAEMAWLVKEADASNEDVLRYEIESGAHNASPLRLAAAKVSLAKKSDARALAASDKRDAREEETLSISKASAAMAAEALSVAKEANRIASDDLTIARSSAESARSNARWAMYAAAVAATAALAANRDQILALIFSSP